MTLCIEYYYEKQVWLIAIHRQESVRDRYTLTQLTNLLLHKIKTRKS